MYDGSEAVVWSDDGQLRALLMPGDPGYDDIPTR